MSIGPVLHAMWTDELEETLLDDKPAHHGIAPLSPLLFTKSSPSCKKSSSVYNVCTVPCTTNFLQSLLQVLCDVAKSLRRTKPEAVLKWTVYYCGEFNKELETTIQSSQIIELELIKLVSFNDLQKSLEKCEVVIAEGLIHIDYVYSGLESIMCNVATLVPFDSHLAQLLDTVNLHLAKSVCLPEKKEEWTQWIEQMLVREEKGMVVDMVKTSRWHNGALHVFADWIGMSNLIKLCTISKHLALNMFNMKTVSILKLCVTTFYWKS